MEIITTLNQHSCGKWSWNVRLLRYLSKNNTSNNFKTYHKSLVSYRYHRYTDVNDRILEVPAVGDTPCLNCTVDQDILDSENYSEERTCWRCDQAKKIRDIRLNKSPLTLQHLCGLSIAASRMNFYHGNLLPNPLKNQLSELVKEINLCGNCSKVRHIGESGFKIFTFKNPYLGNTCVPFIHWACSYECAQEIEVPARKQQLKSAKEQVTI